MKCLKQHLAVYCGFGIHTSGLKKGEWAAKNKEACHQLTSGIISSMRKANKPKVKPTSKILRRTKRMLLKIIWFGLFATLMTIIGTVIFLLFISKLDMAAARPVDLANATIAAGSLLIAILLAFFTGLKKSKNTLVRWSRKSTLILLPFVFVVGVITVSSIKQPQSNINNLEAIEGLTGDEEYVDHNLFSTDDLLKITNIKREENKFGKLKINEKLNKSAQNKCEDMIEKNYWSHYSPNGDEPWVFVDRVGYIYNRSGENLAYGYASATSVINGWMNSPAHRENLLDPDFTEVGFGFCAGEDFNNSGKETVVVQHLGTPRAVQQYTTKPYVAPVCSKKVIPYKTSYEEASWIEKGKTEEWGGEDGYKQSCTSDSEGYKPLDFTYPPYDKTIYKGTYEPYSPNSVPVDNNDSVNPEESSIN
jgi:uncharacterized protein YkwD